MTLQTYLRILRERWKLVVLGMIIGVGLASLVTYSTPRLYEASAQVLVSSNATSDPLAQYQAAAFAQAQVATYADTVPSPDLIKTVKRDLNLAMSDGELRSKIYAVAPAQRSLVDIHATDGSPARAAAIANSSAAAFVKTIEGYTTPDGSSTPSVRLVVTGPAIAPSSPTSPRPALNIAIGFIVGLLAGIALAVARDVLDTRVKTLERLAVVAGKPAMGVIVDDQQSSRHPIATLAGAHNQRAENFRQLRANLQFANVDKHPRIIAVTSSIPGEGKTMVALNLASTLAEAGFTVCLVDADLRRPTVAKLMGLPGAVGLTSVLIQQIDLSEALQIAGPNLFVLSSGPTPPNPAEVLASSYVRDVVRSLLDKVDYVVIDTAPLLPVADGTEVAALADGALFVAQYKVTTEPQVKRALTSLSRVDAPVVGVVLNRVPGRRGTEYGYTYYRSEQIGHSRPIKTGKDVAKADAEVLKTNGHPSSIVKTST